MSGTGASGGGVVGEKATKPVTSVQDCVSTFLCVKPLCIYKQNAF